MQIVHIVNGADIGGAMTQVIALSGAQRKSGTVELIAIGPGKVIANGRRLGIPVRECAMRPAALRRLVRTLREKHDQGFVIHVHGLKPMVMAAIAARGKPLHVAATIHSDFRQEYADSRYRSAVALPLIRWAFGRIERFATVSYELLELLREEGVSPDRREHIPNGVDLSLVAPTMSRQEFLRKRCVPDEGQVICGLAARLHPMKGIDLLIEVAHRFKGEPVQFVVAGSGDPTLMADYREHIRVLGLADQVHMVGFVENIYDFYQAIDVNLLTSYSEGVSYSVMEGAALGRPLVCTAVSGMESLVQDEVDGLKVPVGDADAFAAALRRLVDDPALRHTLGGRSREKVINDYSSEVMARRYDDLYRRLLQVA